MTPAELSQSLVGIVQSIVDGRRSAELGENDATDAAAPVITAADVVLERPKNRDHGDWASNIAMKLAKPLGANPRELATEIAAAAAGIDGIASAEVAGPGFINFRIDAAAAGVLAQAIVEAGDAYGTSDSLAGNTINLEFVSANPTGPLHIGHTRWAALGDSIGRVLRAAGATVANEYYINDAGNQMQNFGASVLAAAQGEPTPEGGYPGAYIATLAEQVLAREPKLLELDDAIALHTATEIAYELQLAEIKASLDRFNVHFDVWTSERTLHAPGEDGVSDIDTAVERLRAQGHVYDEDDAVWVRTTDFGDDKDRVIRRGNGIYTYFAADAAYYLNKGDRGFQHKIYLLGADHHGYVHRLKALAGAAGDDPEKDVEVLIGQLVSINGAKLSKRAGNIIELDDLQAWLGTDALRYTLGRYPADSPLTIDPEILQRKSNDNPVFYVQYVHARTTGVARNAAQSGVDRSGFAPELLDHESESALLGGLQEFPRIVAQAATLREPHRVARYLEELAGLYHRWYDSCRVIPLGDDPVGDVHRTRLWLNDATGQVIRNGLALLGVSAPERM
ncbi:arginine--tRNA ligase [Microterricola viridarii]|uniref:Arginine--tRNA ligase n=1 Tax=Microterricola viridarii TaxID=412690 RepID=A0A120I0P8_9MICO|nr:arginine--tRNA ligase [Microterricola viridarii]AMB57947.1 arginine--tRNA ligase [Microterricola viridarii]